MWAQMQGKLQLHFFNPNDNTDYSVIQHTFKDKNKALIFTIVVHNTHKITQIHKMILIHLNL